MNGSGSESSLDLRRLAPSDAVVALASYPRRFRNALAPVRDDESIIETVTTPGPDGRSALDVARHTLEVWTQISTALWSAHLGAQWRSGGDPADTADDIADDTADDPQEVVERIDSAARSIVDLAGRFTGKDWKRSATMVDGEPGSALDLLREAVAVGHDDLAEISSILAAVRP